MTKREATVLYILFNIGCVLLFTWGLLGLFGVWN